MKMELALNNLQWLICLKSNQPTNQTDLAIRRLQEKGKKEKKPSQFRKKP